MSAIDRRAIRDADFVVDDDDHSEGVFLPRERGGVRRLAISSPYLRKLQIKHFIYFQVLPFLGTIAAIVLAFFRPVTTIDISLFFGMWLLTGLGISAGYHRLLCHRSYKAAGGLRIVMTILGSMAAQGAALSWVAMHRRHHIIADEEGDVHSPNLGGPGLAGRVKGFIHSHFGWMLDHEYPNVAHYVPDLLGDPLLVRVSRRYVTWIVLGLAIPTLLGGLLSGSPMGAVTGLLWGGAVRLLVVGQSISSLNSILHMFGNKRFAASNGKPDNSRNNWLLGLLVWGEGWHNNHHAFPYSASFSLSWYKVDISYWFIRLMQGFGLVHHVRIPKRERIAQRENA